MKAKLWMLGAGLATLLPVLGAGCGGTPKSESKIRFRVRVDDELLKAAETLHVYRLQPAKIDQSTLEDMSKSLFDGGMEGGNPVKVGTVIGMTGTDPSHHLMIDQKTGFVNFTRGMAAQIDDQPGRLPEETEAVTIAERFLQENDLGPDDPKQMVLGRVGRIRSASYDPSSEERGPVRDQMLTVHFARQVDGTPVVGSGSKILVWIGDEGAVVGAGRRWSRLGKQYPLSQKKFRTTQTITKDIESFLLRENADAQSVEILRVALVYFDNGGKFLQPAISYEAEIVRRDFRHRYLGNTELLRNPPESVAPARVGAEMRELLKKSPEKLQTPKREQD